jgi:hypothetical protein
MIKRYQINKRNSTVCGYPGRDFDWSKFDWEGKSLRKSMFSGDCGRRAPKPFVDDGLIAENCQYLHVPYDFEEAGTIYRVRPNDSMYAGEIYRGHRIIQQKAVKDKGIWYWELLFEPEKHKGR